MIPERVALPCCVRLSKFRLLANLITMNRSINLFDGQTLVLAVSVFAFVLLSTNAYGCLVMPQSGAESTLQMGSSRRVDSEAASKAELQLDRPQPDDSQTDSSMTDLLDESLDERDDRPGSDDSQLDDEESNDEESDDDQQDEDDEKDKSPLGSTMIDTNTRSLRVNIAEPNSTAPSDQSSKLIAQSMGNALILPSEKLFAWAAPDIRYQPLYFENVPHERYGQTPEGCELRQTVLSAAHFYGSLVLLPYKLADQHPHSCDWPLGFCQPGSETPFVWQRPIVR